MDDKFWKEVEKVLKKQGVPPEISQDMDTFMAEVAKITQAILSELIPHVLARSVEIVSEGKMKVTERDVPCNFCWRDEEDCPEGLAFPDDCLECLGYQPNESTLHRRIADIFVRYVLNGLGNNRSN